MSCRKGGILKDMKTDVRRWRTRSETIKVSALLMIGFSLVCLSAQAADETTVSKAQLQAAGGNGKAKGKSKPVISERPQVLGLGATNSMAGTTAGQLVNSFQTARADYLKAQKELNLKSTDLTDDQRALAREQAKDALARWQEEHRMYVEEQRERAKTMKQELQADIGRVVDSAGGGGGSGRDR